MQSSPILSSGQAPGPHRRPCSLPEHAPRSVVRAGAALAGLLATAFTLLLWPVPPVVAVEGPVDISVCRSGTIQFLERSKEATVLYIESTGIVAATTDKRFENMTSRCIGVGSNVNGSGAGNGYCKYIDPDGDVNVLSYLVTKRGEGTWQYLHGTGKWAGIQGSGTFKFFTSGKPFSEGTVQSCNRVTGNFTIAK